MKEFDISIAARFYNERFNSYGRNIKTVGWGGDETQKLRFEVLFRGLNPKGKTILDVGCGLGCLVEYLHGRTGGDFCYIGIDVAENLVEDANKKYGNNQIKFYNCDLFSEDMPAVDISVLSGALSLKVEGIDHYATSVMRRMFELSSIASSMNFLSAYSDYELEKNKHFGPETVFSNAMSISKKVNLYHDYPLYEFTLQLLK